MVDGDGVNLRLWIVGSVPLLWMGIASVMAARSDVVAELAAIVARARPCRNSTIRSATAGSVSSWPVTR